MLKIQKSYISLNLITFLDIGKYKTTNFSKTVRYRKSVSEQKYEKL